MPSPLGLVGRGSFDDRVANALQYQMSLNTTPVSLTNPTTATDLMTFLFPTGPSNLGNILNVLGAGFELFCQGTYNLGLASTLVFTIKLGGVTIATFTTASQATTGVTLAWQLTFSAFTASVGSAGTVEAHGVLTFSSGATLAAAASSFMDSNTAPSAAIDLTRAQTLEILANLGSGNAGSSIAQRVLQIQLYQ